MSSLIWYFSFGWQVVLLLIHWKQLNWLIRMEPNQGQLFQGIFGIIALPRWMPHTLWLLITGGYFQPLQSLVIQSDTFEMTSGPDLAGSGRWSHACAHIRHKNGSNYVIAVGGFIGGESTELDTSEIYNADDSSNVWSPGNEIKWYFF